MIKLMLVEDNETMCTLLKTIFELEGYEVNAQYKGSESELLQIFSEFKPDVLMLDINLKNANGLEITRTVRARQGDTVKIILSSGMPLKHDSLKAGADDFIMKPFLPDELLGKVKKLVNQ